MEKKPIKVPVTKYKNVPKTRQEPYTYSVIKYRDVTLYRDVPIYEPRIRRKFLPQKYTQKLTEVNNEIARIKGAI